MEFNNQNIIIYDVSKWQIDIPNKKYIDFEKLKTVGKASAVVFKCGQRNFKDYAFDKGWEDAKKAGLPRGSYWFLDKNETGKNQAKLYWEFLKKDIGEGIHFADYETGAGENWKMLYDFIYEFQQLSGLANHKIGIYTGYPYWVANSPETISEKKWFSKYPLWLAWYTSKPQFVKIPQTWTECLIWQDGTPAIGLSVGVWSKEIDHNYFNGNQERFEYYFGKTGEVPTEEIPSLNLIPTIKSINVTLSSKKILEMVRKENNNG